jgi:hypothetical protein
MEKPEITSFSQAKDYINFGYKAKDWDICKYGMLYFLDNMTLEEILSRLQPIKDMKRAMKWFEMFHYTELSNLPKDSTARKLFMEITHFTMVNAPDQLKDLMNEKLFELFPGSKEAIIGYDDQGRPCFSSNKLKEVFGCSDDDIQEVLNTPGCAINANKINRIN